jgi:hypothetical protein
VPTVSVPGVTSVAFFAQSAAVIAVDADVGDDVDGPAPALSLDPQATPTRVRATSPMSAFRITKPPRSPAEMADPRRLRSEAGA